MRKILCSRLLILSLVILGTASVAYAYPTPTAPDAFCQHAPPAVIAAINVLFALLGLPTIC